MQIELLVGVLNLILGLIYLLAIPKLVYLANSTSLKLLIVAAAFALFLDRWYGGFLRYVFEPDLDVLDGLETVAVIRAAAIVFVILALAALYREDRGPDG